MQLQLTHLDAPAVEGLADELLIQRLRAGEASAGDQLVRRYHQPLTAYLRRLAGSDHLAEELHQATWLSVLEHLDKFVPSPGGGAFKAWLFRIATNKAHDMWRSHGRDKTAKETIRLRIDDQSADASTDAEAVEQQRKLIGAIQQLPENQRVVLLLRFYSEMKFVDIAKMLGCPLNTALGRMHKAMIRLKELMEQ